MLAGNRFNVRKGIMKELSLKQNLLWNTIGCLVYQGCQWLTTIFVVVLSSSYENSGVLAFAMTTGNIFYAFATYSMRTFQVSDIENRYSSENYSAFRIITTCVALAACTAYSLAMATDLTAAFSMVAYLLFKADESFANVLYGIDQKASRMDYIGISQGLRGILSILAFSGALAVGGSLTAAILAMFICCVAVTLTYDLPHSRQLDSVRPSISRAVCSDMFRLCAPNVVATLAYGAVATLARQWFGLSYGDEALGVYAAVATPCVLVQVMANYLYSPFLVPIARSWSGENRSDLRRQLKKLFEGLAIVVVACLTLSAIIGAPVIEFVYGDRIANYSWMITPAMGAASIMAIAGLLTDLFIVMRRFFLAASINIAALVTCAVLMSPFTQIWYMNGINIVISISFGAGIAVGAGGLLISSRKNRRGV